MSFNRPINSSGSDQLNNDTLNEPARKKMKFKITNEVPPVENVLVNNINAKNDASSNQINYVSDAKYKSFNQTQYPINTATYYQTNPGNVQQIGLLPVPSKQNNLSYGNYFIPKFRNESNQSFAPGQNQPNYSVPVPPCSTVRSNFIDFQIPRVKTKKTPRVMPSLSHLHDMVLKNSGWPKDDISVDTYSRWAGALGVLTRGVCKGFTEQDLLAKSKDELILEIGNEDKLLGKVLYEKTFTKGEIKNIPATIMANDVITLVKNHPNQGIKFIAHQAGLGCQQFKEKSVLLFQSKNIKSFDQLKEAIKDNKIGLENTNINIATPSFHDNHNLFFSSPTTEKSSVLDAKTNNKELDSPETSPILQQPVSLDNALSTADLMLENSSENFLLNYPAVKVEPTVDNDCHDVEMTTPVLKLKKVDLNKVIKILKGKDFDSSDTNCALFAEEIIKYFQTSIMPTLPVGKNYSKDQFETIEYEVEPIVLPKSSVKIKQEFSQSNHHSQFQSRYSTRSKQSNQTQKVDTIVRTKINRNTTFGALAPYDLSYLDSTGTMDLTKPPAIHLETSTQTQHTIHSISSSLMHEAGRNPFGVSFGIVCLESFGEELETRLGHMLVYYATTTNVTYIDVHEKPSIFNNISEVYKTAKSDKERDEMTYGHFVFSSQMGPFQSSMKRNTHVAQSAMKQMNVSNTSTRRENTNSTNDNYREEMKTKISNKK